QSLSVPAAAALTLAPGVTLTAKSTAGTLSVAGTLMAVGASSANRNVVFNNVAVNFQNNSTGMLPFCTLAARSLSYPLLLQGTTTVSDCTITVSGNGFGINAGGGTPAISSNTITARYGVYVSAGSPAITGNTISTSYAGLYYAAGGGTASGNSIGFSG